MEERNCPMCSQRKKERSPEEYKKLINRLSRIEGQIRGIRSMVENGAYCPDILVQSAAANAALNAFNKELLANHLRSCVANDIREGHDEIIDELVNHANLKVHKGEIVGLYGLMGAGRTEMAMSIFGHQYGQRTSGHVFKDGKEMKITDPKSAIEQGLSYLSEDRKGMGLILGESIELNTTLAALERVTNHMIINRYEEARAAQNYVKLMHTKCTSIGQPVLGLSGGNQQKVLDFFEGCIEK